MIRSLSEIADLIQGTVIGDPALTIHTLSTIDDIQENALVFAEGYDKLKIAEASSAAVILVNKHVTESCKPLIQVTHPLKAFISLLNHFHKPVENFKGIHSTAIVASDVQIGENVSLGPYAVVESGSSIGNNTVIKSHVHIGHGVQIGNYSTLHPHVTVYDHCAIGSYVTIHASTVIGSDGFGYTFTEGAHLKIPHHGNVRIDDQVEIGANTAIDRATLGSTIIGEGTKIDNLVQVAHSVKLGKHNILCGFTGIAGSTTSGDHVIFAANVGVSDHVSIGDGVILGARAGVASKKRLNPGMVYIGSPARPKDLAIKHELAVNKIPLIRKQVSTLSEKIELLNTRLAQLEKEKS